MKSYEKESFIKAFALFFSVQLLFLSIVMYQHYHKLLHEYDMYVGNNMMQCYLGSNCTKFKTDTMKYIAKQKLHVLYKEEKVYMLFKLKDIYIKMYISRQEYNKHKSKITKHSIEEYILYTLLLILISLLFALYTLRPLEKALKLNEEFVKDILHDFNTPISSLNINHKILKRKFGNNEAIIRSEESINNILSLQNNLHFFLNQSKLQNETINLETIVNERVSYFKNIFTDINFNTEVKNIKILTNKIAFIRVLDNLISNAGKYNKRGGSINISTEKNILIIKDSGVGIKNIDKIFQRYYKENDRGLGIGLHVVKKLSHELHINISAKSILNEGSTFFLDINKVMLK